MNTDNLSYETKTENIHEGFTNNNEIYNSSNYWTRSIYCKDLNKLLVGKTNDYSGFVASEKSVQLKPKVYWFAVDNNRKHKKTKDVKKCCYINRSKWI